ncbi:MAG: hypothetical protein IJG59_04070 [Erysipelotrichaceae bacterium]|nr:hypothetical protein [Erysipelotrichaceae bacterium]
MKTMLWNLLGSLGVSKKIRKNLFLALITILYALIGYVLWLVIGERLFPEHRDWMWMLCFVCFSAFFPGFLSGIIYLYKYE